MDPWNIVLLLGLLPCLDPQQSVGASPEDGATLPQGQVFSMDIADGFHVKSFDQSESLDQTFRLEH